MGNNLNGLSEKSTFPFFINNRLVNSAGSNIIGLCSENIQKTFVVPQIQVGFCTIFRNVTLPMLIGVEGTWIYIDIGIKFLNGHLETTGLQ